jgi:TPP-dependent pyruvate/acetoin dehydrogenase alpha subunit
MSAIRQAEPVLSATEASQAGLDRERLLRLYRDMLATRTIEERGNLLFKAGRLPGSYYTGRGNEAASVGVASAMGEDDVASPLHRNMGVHVVRGVDPAALFCQYMGRSGGATGGRDSNLRTNDFSPGVGLLAGVSHLPAMIPVITGMALAFQLRGEPRVAVGWCGDGAAARGDMHESMNLAGVRGLPIVYIIDNNQYAYSTPNSLSFACEHLADRGPAYGFEGIVVDGTDVLTVYREAARAIEKARAGGGPTLLELITLRMEGHAVHDDAAYVPRSLVEEFTARDPVDRYRAWLQVNEELTDEEQAAIEAEVRAADREGRGRRREPARCPTRTPCWTASTRYRPRNERLPVSMFGGGDPEEIQRQLAGFMEQAQQQQKVAFADQAINLAVGMTVAAIGRLELSGDPDQQAMQVRDAIRLLFPEAVTLVSEARQGLA